MLEQSFGCKQNQKNLSFPNPSSQSAFFVKESMYRIEDCCWLNINDSICPLSCSDQTTIFCQIFGLFPGHSCQSSLRRSDQVERPEPRPLMSKSFVNNIASDQSFCYLPTKAKLALALDTAKGTRSSTDNNSSNLHKYNNNIPAYLATVSIFLYDSNILGLGL